MGTGFLGLEGFVKKARRGRVVVVVEVIEMGEFGVIWFGSIEMG